MFQIQAQVTAQLRYRMKKTIYWENGVDLSLNDLLPCVDDKTLVFLLQHLSGDQLVSVASNNGRSVINLCFGN